MTLSLSLFFYSRALFYLFNDALFTVLLLFVSSVNVPEIAVTVRVYFRNFPREK